MSVVRFIGIKNSITMDNDIIINTLISHPREFISWIVAVVAVIFVIYKLVKNLIKFMESYHKTKGKLEKEKLELEKHTEQINELNKKFDTTMNAISKIQDKIDDMQKTSNANDVCIMRDSILRVYKNILSYENRYILESDLQNFEALVERYYSMDGNGFVKNVVEPYIKSLPVFLSDEQAVEFFKNN